MLKNLTLFIISGFAFTTLARSAYADFRTPVRHQTERFLADLDNVESNIVRVNRVHSDEDKIYALDSEDLRSSLRNLQNLFRIYGQKEKKYPKFKEYSAAAKQLEDFISHYRDLDYFRDRTRYEQEDIREKHARAYTEGKAEYIRFIRESSWFTVPGGMVDEMRSFLQSFDWPPLRKDRDDLLEGIATILEKYHEKEYDMSLVEDGMHELRRDARRLSYLNYAVNLIDTSYNLTCPIGGPVAEGSRSVANQFQCEIPSCLTEELSSASSELSWLKHDALDYELSGDPIPNSIIGRGESYRDELKEKQVFLHIAVAIESCREPKHVFE